MRKWVGNTLIAGAIAAAAAGIGYRIKYGVPVEAAAVADFNGNGSKDVAYWYYPYAESNHRALKFVDGNIVKGSGNTYHVPFSEYNFSIGFMIDRTYFGERDMAVNDVNGDGKIDLILRDPNLDPLIYIKSGDVFLGDGTGNFRFSQKRATSR